MLKTFHVTNQNELKPGQTVSAWNGMPDGKLTESYQIVKLVSYDKKNDLGEYQVRPVDVSKDPGDLTDGKGRPSKGLR